MLPDDLCHHPEGWGPISRLRPFDLTPCFEDAVFSVPLGLLIAFSLLRSWQLSRLNALHRTQKINTWLLWVKLVRGFRVPLIVGVKLCCPYFLTE
jgi:hypothetical protein